MFADESTYQWHGDGSTMAHSTFAGVNWKNALIYKDGSYINTAVHAIKHPSYQSVCAVLSSPMMASDSSRLGKDRIYPNGFVGDICELITFSTYLSQEEITEINRYFNAKWGEIIGL
jgi:hypothetical protein